MLKILLQLFILFIISSYSLAATTQRSTATTPSTTTTPSMQNNTTYTFALTGTTIYKATCSPSCAIASTLAPKAKQAYAVTDPTGYINFDYDIKNGTTLVGHLTLHATATAVTVTNGLGGTATTANSVTLVSYVAPIPIWTSQFTDIKNWQANNWKVTKLLSSWGAENIQVMQSVPTRTSPKGDNYLRINYPAGSANPGSSPPLPLGGTQFYAALLNSTTPIVLSFYISFPATFPFENGLTGTQGKLPGLYSGTGNTGDNVPSGNDGWTMRFMWCDYVESTNKKVVAGGQVLQFTAGSNVGQYGHDYGTALGCSNWSFAADGKWHNIQEIIYLNDPGVANGRVDICYDGRLVLSQQGITYRKIPTLAINGIVFQSFFGGNGSAYATPSNTYIDFADFALYPYPTTASRGLCLTNP